MDEGNFLLICSKKYHWWMSELTKTRKKDKRWAAMIFFSAYIAKEHIFSSFSKEIFKIIKDGMWRFLPSLIISLLLVLESDVPLLPSLFSCVFSCHLEMHFLLVTTLLLTFSFSSVEISLSWLFILSLSLSLSLCFFSHCQRSCPSSSSFNKFVGTHQSSSSLSSLYIHRQT